MGATLSHAVPSIFAPSSNSACGGFQASAVRLRRDLCNPGGQWEELEQASSISVCLSVCVQRAALKAPTPGGRTLSFQRFVRPFRCGLLPRGKLGSPSTNLFHSPWEWVATAHPPGKHVPHPADKLQKRS